MYQRPLLLDGPAAAAERPASSARALPRTWDAAPDLERFLASFYQYFELRGYWGVLAAHLSHIAALAFTIGFSFVLLFFVNWRGLLSCSSEESCRVVQLWYDHPLHHVGPWRLLALMSFLLFLVYWLFNVAAAYSGMMEAAKMSVYYQERLGITSDRMLSTMLWSEVVSRLIQQQKISPFCIVQDDLTALEIANIIMREDNFMIALTNHNAFTSHLPTWVPPRLVYTRAVHWNLRTAVFRWFFDERSRIRADFVDRPMALAQRLQWLGALNLVLMVPVLLFVTIFFFMRHAEEFRSHRTSPFERQWTGYAHWTFREFNELPHNFKARMCHAQSAAESYVRSTREPTPVLDSIRRFAKFVAGSILAVLLVVALYDDTPLLFVKIQDKNLLWYLALFGFLFAVADNAQEAGGQSCSQDKPSLSPCAPLHMHAAMMKLVRCTHFLPVSWRAPAPLEELAGGCGGVRRANLCEHFRRVRCEFLREFFVHRIQALAEELLGVVICPLLLMVYLPQAAPEIADVIRRSRYSSKNLGDWCALGCLDPSRNGSDWYGAPPRFAGSGSAGEPPAMLGWGSREISSQGGKLEKSVLSFLLAHQLPWLFREGDEDPPLALGAERRRHIPGVLALGRGARRSRPSSGWGAALGRGGEEIAMRDLAADAASASDGPPPPAADFESCADTEVADVSELWGYPPSALRLLQDLEEFQERETSSPHGVSSQYSLFNEELVGSCPRRRASQPSASRCAAGALARPVALAAEEEQGGCGPLFFWLEALYDARSGRSASSTSGSAAAASLCGVPLRSATACPAASYAAAPYADEAGPATSYAATPYADEATFELLEREASP